MHDTYNVFDRTLPPFAVHLRNSIATGSTLSYTPDRAIYWSISRQMAGVK